MIEDEPLDRVSEISEISEGMGDYHFISAVCWGTLAGTGAFWFAALIDSPTAPGFGWLASIVILLIIAPFAGLSTLAGMVAIGLPITLALSMAKQESAVIYGAAGTLAGFLVFLIIVGFPDANQLDALLFCLVGAVPGGVCAYRWGRWREFLAERAKLGANEEPTVKRTNPIHDLLH